MKPEHVHSLLLKHLGITYILSVHSRGDGHYSREHHLYAQGPVHDLLQAFPRLYSQDEPIRVFQSPPPPF